MVVDLNTLSLKALAIGIGARLTIVVGDDYSTHAESQTLEYTTQTQNILIVGDTQVAAHLVLLDIQSADYENHLGLILQLQEHLQLAVGLKTWQNTTCVVVVEQLASKLQVEFVAKLLDALFDMLRLYF